MQTSIEILPIKFYTGVFHRKDNIFSYPTPNDLMSFCKNNVIPGTIIQAISSNDLLMKINQHELFYFVNLTNGNIEEIYTNTTYKVLRDMDYNIKNVNIVLGELKNSSRLQTVKSIKELTGLGLKEAKDIVDEHYEKETMIELFTFSSGAHLNLLSLYQLSIEHTELQFHITAKNNKNEDIEIIFN